MSIFAPALLSEAEATLSLLRAHGLSLVTAESCTGGMIATVLTEIAGASDILDRGFITYSNDAKVEMLGVHPDLIDRHGAVSAEVARAMAEGALVHAEADIAVAVTGIAGPGGGSQSKPVGLVFLAAARLGAPAIHKQLCLGDIGRSAIRLATTSAALDLIGQAARLDSPETPE